METPVQLKNLTLNVIVPTYNRAALLKRTLQSLANADSAANLTVSVTVVDNNSTDDTRAAVAACEPLFTKIQLEYVFEPRQGKTFALNTALAKTRDDLISIVDDDEEIAADWYLEIAKLFGARWNEIDFAGGKVLPRWENGAPPSWFSPNNPVIGWRDFGEEEWFYSRDTAILSGGHAIIKREIFDQLGFFNEKIGPTGKNLQGCEDDVLYDKLLDAGKIGVYNPRFIIYHFIPDYRLTKNYYRQWCYGNGASQQMMDVHYKAFDGARIFGVPRFMYRSAAISLLATIKAKLTGNSKTAYANESNFWVFCGYFNERNLKNSRYAEPLRKVTARLLPSVTR